MLLIADYSAGDNLEFRYPLEALKMALDHYSGKDLRELIHHSDRGVQYASYAYTSVLKNHQIRICRPKAEILKTTPWPNGSTTRSKTNCSKGWRFTELMR